MMKLKTKIHKILDGFNTFGCEFFVNLISVCCPAWLFRYSHSYLFQGKRINLNLRKNIGYEIRFVNIEDLERLNNFRTDIAKARERLSRGDICVVTVRSADDSVVANLWASTGALYSEYTGTFFDTGDEGFYLYSVYTIDDERSKGLYSSMLSCLIRHYNDNNRFIIYANVDFFNIISIYVKKKIGFKIVGESFFFKIFYIYICYYKYWNDLKTNRFVFYIKKNIKKMKLV